MNGPAREAKLSFKHNTILWLTQKSNQIIFSHTEQYAYDIT